MHSFEILVNKSKSLCLFNLMKGILSHIASKYTGKINPVKVNGLSNKEKLSCTAIIYMYRLFPLINIFQNAIHTLNMLPNFQDNMKNFAKCMLCFNALIKR